MEFTNRHVYDKQLNEILKGVSRSFYLTLRMLPDSVRPQMSVAYLIARASDTVADTNIIPVENRIKALRSIRSRVLSDSPDTANISTSLTDSGSMVDFSNHEKLLLENFEKVLNVYRQFPEGDRRLIKKVISDITTGQELDLTRFSNASANNIVCLNDDKDLDEYTFFVAGTVGDFWTHMCFLHVIEDNNLSEEEMSDLGIRYGKGLQLINILRDLPSDLKKGRCYIPICHLKNQGLSPLDLLAPCNEDKFRPVYNYYIKLAYNYLGSGSEYIFQIPKRYFRLRFVTALPLLIGIKTLEKMHSGKILDPEQKIKISRTSVRRLIAWCILLYPIPTLWKKLFRSKTLESLLPTALSLYS